MPSKRVGTLSSGLLPGLALALLGSPAAADSNSVGVSFTTDRNAHDLDDPKAAKVKISASHSFDTGVILGASGEYSNTAFSDSATVKLEGTAGYRAALSDRFSVTGSAGLGENIQASGSGDSFPYYVLRIGADFKATEDVTWNLVTFRYRDGFDPDDNFLTPQVATGLSYDLDEHNSISGVAQYNWKDWKPDTVGFELGYKYRF
jgi:Outer membrane protein beta-barrel domain